MSRKKKRYEMESGVYVLDTSGTASEGKQMKRLADATAKRVDEHFDASKLRSSRKRASQS